MDIKLVILGVVLVALFWFVVVPLFEDGDVSFSGTTGYGSTVKIE